MKLYLSYRVRLDQYWQSWHWNFCTFWIAFPNSFQGLPARLNPPTVSGLVGSLVVLGKKKGPPLTLGSWLCSILHSVKKCLAITLPTLAPFSLFNWFPPAQQAKEISFWLKPKVTRWKLKSLILICIYWGIVDVSFPSFCDISKCPLYRLICKILIRWGKLSFISEIVWSIIYDPANKPGAHWDEYLLFVCKQSSANVQAAT